VKRIDLYLTSERKTMIRESDVRKETGTLGSLGRQGQPKLGSHKMKDRKKTSGVFQDLAPQTIPILIRCHSW